MALQRPAGAQCWKAGVKPTARPMLAARPVLRAQQRIAVVRAAGETAIVAGSVTDETFEQEVLNCNLPVLIDFWAPWCGPCRMIAPLIDEIANEYKDKLKCVKLNTDESPGVATEYGIRSIPTIIIFKNGQKQETIIGAVPKATLLQSIDKFL